MLKSFFVAGGNRIAAVVARTPSEVRGGDDVGVGGEVDIRLFGVGI